MLDVRNLSKQFILHNLGGKCLQAFSEVSFTLEAGRFLALSGPSGSGKSSIVKCINRTYLATGGAIHYRSIEGVKDLALLPEQEMIPLRQREIAYVSQFLRVLPRVGALDVVAEPLCIQGIPREKARDQARSLLRRLNIPDGLHDASPATFSGGEQQRINIARAVIGGPRLLLLDEPTASLDKDSAHRVIAVLQELKAQGTAMVGIFHDPLLMKAIADDIYHVKAKDEAHAAA